MIEKEISGADGRSYQLRILRVRTAEGKHEGVVITLADFTRGKKENASGQ